MGFELVERRGETLVYETGHLTFYVKESGAPHPPVLSFRVRDLGEAREYLVENGCEVTAEWDRALYFRDPFGVVHDIIKWFIRNMPFLNKFFVWSDELLGYGSMKDPRKYWGQPLKSD